MRTCFSPLVVDSSLDNEKFHGQSRTSTSIEPLFHGIHFGVLQDLLGLFDSYLLKRWAPGSEKALDSIDRAREDWLAKGLIGLAIRAEAACAHARAQPDDLGEAEPLIDVGA